MKNIIIIIFLLSSITALAQKDAIHGKYNYVDTLQLSKYKNNFAGDSVLTTDTLGKIHMKFIQPGNGSGIKKVGDPTLGLLVPNDSTYILDTARHADTAKTGLLSNIDYKKFNSAYYSFVQAPDSSNVPFKKLDGTPDDTLVVVNVGGTSGDRPYRSYTALFKQTSSGADPTVVELENNTGATATWTRSSAGGFVGAFSGAVFTTNKTFMSGVLMGVTTPNNLVTVMSSGGPGSIAGRYSMWINGTGTIDIDTWNSSNVSTDWFDLVGASAEITIEIRIYN